MACTFVLASRQSQLPDRAVSYTTTAAYWGSIHMAHSKKQYENLNAKQAKKQRTCDS